MKSQSVGILHHKCFGNAECVKLVCLGLANVIFKHYRGFDGIQHTRCNYRQQDILQGCRRSMPSIEDQ